MTKRRNRAGRYIPGMRLGPYAPSSRSVDPQIEQMRQRGYEPVYDHAPIHNPSGRAHSGRIIGWVPTGSRMPTPPAKVGLRKFSNRNYYSSDYNPATGRFEFHDGPLAPNDRRAFQAQPKGLSGNAISTGHIDPMSQPFSGGVSNTWGLPGYENPGSGFYSATQRATGNFRVRLPNEDIRTYLARKNHFLTTQEANQRAQAGMRNFLQRSESAKHSQRMSLGLRQQVDRMISQKIEDTLLAYDTHAARVWAEAERAAIGDPLAKETLNQLRYKLANDRTRISRNLIRQHQNLNDREKASSLIRHDQAVKEQWNLGRSYAEQAQLERISADAFVNQPIHVKATLAARSAPRYEIHAYYKTKKGQIKFDHTYYSTRLPRNDSGWIDQPGNSTSHAHQMRSNDGLHQIRLMPMQERIAQISKEMQFNPEKTAPSEYKLTRDPLKRDMLEWGDPTKRQPRPVETGGWKKDPITGKELSPRVWEKYQFPRIGARPPDPVTGRMRPGNLINNSQEYYNLHSPQSSTATWKWEQTKQKWKRIGTSERSWMLHAPRQKHTRFYNPRESITMGGHFYTRKHDPYKDLPDKGRIFHRRMTDSAAGPSSPFRVDPLTGKQVRWGNEPHHGVQYMYENAATRRMAHSLSIEGYNPYQVHEFLTTYYGSMSVQRQAAYGETYSRLNSPASHVYGEHNRENISGPVDSHMGRTLSYPAHRGIAGRNIWIPWSPDRLRDPRMSELARLLGPRWKEGQAFRDPLHSEYGVIQDQGLRDYINHHHNVGMSDSGLSWMGNQARRQAFNDRLGREQAWARGVDRAAGRAMDSVRNDPFADPFGHNTPWSAALDKSQTEFDQAKTDL
jgi:hypothetical protein